MVFKNMSILGVSYGQNYEDVPAQTLEDKDVSNFNMVDDNLDQILQNQGPESSSVTQFLNSLALCHTIVTSQDPKDESKFILNTSSPDELSLINGAKFYGVQFIERNQQNQIVLKYLNQNNAI